MEFNFDLWFYGFLFDKLFAGVLFSKTTTLSYLLQNGFTLEMLDENLDKHSFPMEPVTILQAEADDVKEKIKVQ